jgi:hypothetical protein
MCNLNCPTLPYCNWRPQNTNAPQLRVPIANPILADLILIGTCPNSELKLLKIASFQRSQEWIAEATHSIAGNKSS